LDFCTVTDSLTEYDGHGSYIDMEAVVQVLLLFYLANQDSLLFLLQLS